MALIYGIADSERNLLDKLPNEVENVDDIERAKEQFVKKWGKERYWYSGKSLDGIIFSGITQSTPQTFLFYLEGVYLDCKG